MTDRTRVRWTLHGVSELSGLRDDWLNLTDRLGQSLPMSFDFVACLVEGFDPPAVLLARLGDDRNLYALALLQRQSPFVWRTPKLDNAPLGLWLIDPAIDLEEALQALLRTLPGRPLMLALSGLDPALMPRPCTSSRTRTLDYMLTPAIAIDGPFDCWFGTRSKNLRHNLRRQARRLAESGVAVEIRCLTAPKQMAEAVALYAGLEACGWKSKAGTAVTPGSRQERFYRQLLEHFAKRGEAQVWQILFDGVLAASDLCLSSAGITVILKTAYNEALADKHTSPAQILRRDMFETLFGTPGARRIEFFGPFKPWHRSWTDEQRQLYHLNHYRFAPIAYFHAFAGRLRKRRKRADAADTERR